MRNVRGLHCEISLQARYYCCYDKESKKPYHCMYYCTLNALEFDLVHLRRLWMTSLDTQKAFDVVDHSSLL